MSGAHPAGLADMVEAAPEPEAVLGRSFSFPSTAVGGRAFPRLERLLVVAGPPGPAELALPPSPSSAPGAAGATAASRCSPLRARLRPGLSPRPRGAGRWSPSWLHLGDAAARRRYRRRASPGAGCPPRGWPTGTASSVLGVELAPGPPLSSALALPLAAPAVISLFFDCCARWSGREAHAISLSGVSPASLMITRSPSRQEYGPPLRPVVSMPGAGGARSALGVAVRCAICFRRRSVLPLLSFTTCSIFEARREHSGKGGPGRRRGRQAEPCRSPIALKRLPVLRERGQALAAQARGPKS